jgi:hypothetical protein
MPSENRHRCSEVRLRRVEKLRDQRMFFEHMLNDAALHAGSAAVNQPDLAQSRALRGANIFVDDRWNVPGKEGVEVEARFDRNLKRAAVVWRVWRVGQAHGFS